MPAHVPNVDRGRWQARRQDIVFRIQDGFNAACLVWRMSLTPRHARLSLQRLFWPLCASLALATCVSAGQAQSVSSSASTLREAIDLVEQDTGGRILAAETVTSGSKRIYRIKVLTPDGRVRVVQIKATGDSGES